MIARHDFPNGCRLRNEECTIEHGLLIASLLGQQCNVYHFYSFLCNEQCAIAHGLLSAHRPGACSYNCQTQLLSKVQHHFYSVLRNEQCTIANGLVSAHWELARIIVRHICSSRSLNFSGQVERRMLFSSSSFPMIFRHNFN